MAPNNYASDLSYITDTSMVNNYWKMRSEPEKTLSKLQDEQDQHLIDWCDDAQVRCIVEEVEKGKKDASKTYSSDSGFS